MAWTIKSYCGASGIGQATVHRLARDGAHVIVADVQMDLTTSVVAEVKNAGGSEVCELDVAARARRQVQSSSRGAKLNNAGIVGPTTKLLEIEPAEWARVMSVNLTGVFSCVQAEIAQMVQQESGGSIVNASSICGLVALPQATAYNAAKHGVISAASTTTTVSMTVQGRIHPCLPKVQERSRSACRCGCATHTPGGRCQ